MKERIQVYISAVRDDPTHSLPPYINKDSVTNKRLLSESGSAYALLRYGVKQEYGIDMDMSMLTKTENGKPVYPGLHFSLSHSKGMCAVALGGCEVGIDIEEKIIGERADRIKARILHPNEDPDTDVTGLWTKKEAVFKLLGGKIFVASKIDTTAYHTFTARIGNTAAYTFTVAAENEFEVIIKNV